MEKSIDMDEIKNTQIIFGEEKEEIDLRNLSFFLMYLNAHYQILCNHKELTKGFSFRDSKINFTERDIANRIFESEYSNRNYTPYFSVRGRVSGKSLPIRYISYNSPLEIVLSAMSIPLIAALILSGGKLEFESATFSFKIRLKSLGESLVKLEEYRQTVWNNSQFKIEKKREIEENKSRRVKEELILMTNEIVINNLDSNNQEIQKEIEAIKKLQTTLTIDRLGVGLINDIKKEIKKRDANIRKLNR